MSEENMNNEEMNIVDPLELLEEIKANSVPKEKFDKLQSDYSKLFKAYANGERGKSTDEPEESPEERWKKNCEILQNKTKHDNITIAKALKEGDDYYRLKYGKSIFCSQSGSLDSGEEKVADKVNSTIAYCLENANDDNETFTNFFLSKLN